MIEPLKILDTFAGIGGFSYAAEKLVRGFETTQFVEIDPYCQKILKKHWPHVPIHDDIKTFTAYPGQYDVITGGFPCTDISTAGKGLGITKETRSGLFYELIRVIRLVRPKFIVLENVAAILNNGLDIVLGELSETGYDAEWAVISASSLGACHRRSRWWLVAYPNSNGYQGQCFETRNKATSGQDTSGKWSTNTSDFERQSDDGNDQRESRTDENLSGSSNGGKTTSSETEGICKLSEGTDNNQEINRENNNQEDNDRALVSQGQSRVQLSIDTKLGRDQTTLKNNSIRQGNDNDSKQRMDNQKPDASYSQVIRMEGMRSSGQQVKYKMEQTRLFKWRYQRDLLSPDWRAYASEPVLRRGDDGLSNRVDRLKCLGNSIVPSVAAIPLQRVHDLYYK